MDNKERLQEIKKELKKQRTGIQGCVANPKRYLDEQDITWLISEVERLQAENEIFKNHNENGTKVFDHFQQKVERLEKENSQLKDWYKQATGFDIKRAEALEGKE